MRCGVEVTGGVHGIAPLWGDDPDRVQVLFDAGGGGAGSECSMIDHERLLLQRCIGSELKSGDLVRGDA